MKELIEALQLLQTFIPKDSYHQKYPTYCEHEVLYVYGIDWNKVKFNDVYKIIKFGFYPGDDTNQDYIYELLGDNFDWDELTEEQWNQINKLYLDDCCYSYTYGSC